MITNFDSNKINKSAYKKVDDYEDNFAKINNIKTQLMFGEIKTNNPFLTVIIPTYKRKTLLKEAINSVLKQKTNFSWEFIIIDNTELDKCKETPALKIVKKINDERILYYHNDVNIGSGYSWNRAVELAHGKWITFLHDDDVLCENALGNISNIIKKYQHIKKPLGYIHARKKNFTGIFKENLIKFKKIPFNLELTRFTTLILGHTHTGMPTCGTTILKEAYVNAGGINYDFGPTADAVLGYKIMQNYTVIRSGATLGGYRWMDNETLKIHTIKQLIISDKLFAEYRYALSKFSFFWGMIFGNIQMRINVNDKLAILKKYEVNDIAIGEYENITKNNLKIFLYKIIILICKICMCIKGIILYR